MASISVGRLPSGPLGFERGDGLAGRVTAGTELGDTALGERDDRVVGIVVFLEPQRLAVEAPVEIVALTLEAVKLGVVVAPVLGDGLGEVVAQQAQALGPEQPPPHEVEQLVDDQLLLDLQGARVAGDVGGDAAAAGAEAAAVTLRALLVAASMRRSHRAQWTRPRST